jgi:hypothetical protein
VCYRFATFETGFFDQAIGALHKFKSNQLAMASKVNEDEEHQKRLPWFSSFNAHKLVRIGWICCGGGH